MTQSLPLGMTPFLVIYSILAGFGGIFALNFVIRLFWGIYARVLRPGRNLKRTYGSWAVITGGTDGIGRGFAFELARKGLNIILISRSADKLSETASEITSQYPKTEVRTVVVDFSNFNEAARNEVSDALAYVDVGVLVNNVGFSYPFTKFFDELDDILVEQLIRINVDSTTWMTKIVLPGMKARRRGAIVNIGSAAGVSTSPLLAQYGAAKSYVAMFTRALNYELQGFGIHVQCQVPMFVTTKLAKLRKTSVFVPSPGAYARAAVAAIGYETVVSPYWSHALQIWALTTLPEALVAKITFDMHKGIRKAGMRKEERDKALSVENTSSKDKSS